MLTGAAAAGAVVAGAVNEVVAVAGTLAGTPNPVNALKPGKIFDYESVL